ncbi:hypothetical protein CROQUDRAFT_79403 [Cronartium quercuum f. sp. fusiforme G11]|uniref:Arginine N-methyltransferase 2 n=1 Tax=Cronartium quercuum f. sp. fusiforme G11 TaxID=708437 RepID=A0A9P6NF65_9BASI|nr:hypothetical protein CROQUDRAFT_79403 [Cronartium quercuum f. sp. fusiforme G11]
MSSPRTQSVASTDESCARSTYIRDLPEQEQALARGLLQACEKSDVKEVARLLDCDQLPSFSLQDDDGWTALHYAATSSSTEVIKLLLGAGALWAMTDHLGHTAGDVAFSMNDKPMYDLFCDHGFRAEMLRRALDAKLSLSDDSSVPMKSRTEVTTASDNAAFLASRLTYQTNSTGQAVCMDSEGNGVMLGWEDNIMRQTAERLCEHQKNCENFELSVLNVGFGLGLVDSYLQTHSPHRHVIIEPHPDVLRFMEQNGWHLKPGVEIYRGRWQAFFEEVEAGKIVANFDAIYWDTFSENYDDLKEVFDRVFNMLSGPNSRFSWFHGLGATSATLYEIYTRIAELDLHEAGFKTIWHEVDVEGGEAIWEGIKRRYWNIPTPYRLPICMYDM